MEGKYRASLGDALELAMETAKQDWRLRYAATSRLSELMAGPVANVLTEVLELPGGRCNITVIINARKRVESETYFHRMLKRENAWEFVE